MVKRILFWQSPVLGAVIFVLMTCAELAAESPDNNNLTPLYVSKLHKSWNSVYFYDCWRNSGNSMAVVNAFTHETVLAPGQLAAFYLLNPPARWEQQAGAAGQQALSWNNLCSTGYHD